MGIIRIKEIRALSAEDMAKKLVDIRAELARIRTMVKAGGAVENPTRVWELRKTIAQILTIQNEQKLGIRQPEQEAEEKPKKKAEKTVKDSKKPNEEAKETSK
jgi:large subunit ribosomal protein L29